MELKKKKKISRYKLVPEQALIERLSTHMRIQGPGHLQRVSLSVPSVQRFPSPPACGLPEDASYQSQTTCPRPSLQPPQLQIINPSSTMPSKLTRRRPRKISAPIHYSTNSRTVILQMPSSAYFINKFPSSTNLVVPITN